MKKTLFLVESKVNGESSSIKYEIEKRGYIQSSVTPEQRGIFIHVPKTAGCTVYRHTGSLAPRMFYRHSTALLVQNKIGIEAWRRIFSFAFVRNPWSRMVSMFRFYKINHFCGEDETFCNWLESFIRSPQVKGDQYSDIIARAPITQETFLTDPEGIVIVNYIGRMEKFDLDFTFICQRIGISSNPITYNKMSPVDWHEFYNPSASQMIIDSCQWEINKFGYTFNND